MHLQKKNLKQNILLLFLFLVFTGCDQKIIKKQATDNNPIHFDVSSWKKSEKISDKLIKRIDYIPLETNDSCLISGIGKLLIHDDMLYVLDNQFGKTILIFNKKGRYINSIGSYGKGRGESLGIDDFIIDKNDEKLFILDRTQRKVLIFKLKDGTFHSEFYVKFLPHNFIMVSDNTLGFYSKFQGNKQGPDYSIAFLNLEDKSCKWFLEKDEYDTRIGEPFSIFQSKKIYYSSYLKDVVYRITEDDVFPAITFNFGESKFPSDRLKKCNNRSSDLRKLFNEGGWTYGVGDIFENDNFITFKIKLEGERNNVIYSKRTGSYFYGSNYEGALIFLRMTKFLEVNNNKFIGQIDSNIFKKMKKLVIEQGGNSEFKNQYLETEEIVSAGSNPIVILIEYNKF